MLLYRQFYNMYGVRKMDQIARPPLPRIERFQLPKWSMVHYLGASVEDNGPRTDWIMYQRNDAPIKIKHIFELAKKEGNPRRTMQQGGELQRNFRSENPRFRNFTGLEDSLRMPLQVNTVNYAFIPRLYRYQRQRLTMWNKLYNLMYTVFSEIKSMEGQGFNQFLEIEVPKVLPKPSVLRNAEHFRTMDVYNTFAEPRLFMMLQIWKWLGPNRETSMLHEIFPEGFKDLNLIIREADRFCVVSLERLSEWRRASAKELRMNEDANRRGIAPEEAQLRFLRLLMSVANLRSEDLPESLYDAEGDQLEGTHATDATGSSNIIVGSTVGRSDGFGEGTSGTSEQEEETVEDSEVDGAMPQSKKDQAFLEVIEKDIDVLEEFGADLSTLAVDNVQVDYDTDEPAEAVDPAMIEQFDPLDQDALEAIQVEPVPAEPKDAYLRRCAELADRGDITAAEYRRAVESVQNGKMAVVDEIPIDEFSKVAPEKVAIDPVQVAPDTDVVVDKSMLNTTLAEFDSKYVQEVMPKDVAGMVYNLMGAGINVTSYETKEVSTINGEHIEYTVHIKPLVGKSSVLRFKIPKIDDEGKFTIGGVKYTLRKQKGD